MQCALIFKLALFLMALCLAGWSMRIDRALLLPSLAQAGTVAPGHDFDVQGVVVGVGARIDNGMSS